MSQATGPFTATIEARQQEMLDFLQRIVAMEEYLEVPSLFQKTALLAGVLNRLVGPGAHRALSGATEETEEER